MKVKDLIERLSGLDAEAEVHFSYNYGDHWRTKVAPTVDLVEEGIVEYSDYHRMDKLVDDEDCYDDDSGDFKEGFRQVVVLGQYCKARLTQPVEYLISNQEVGSSNLSTGTKYKVVYET